MLRLISRAVAKVSSGVTSTTPRASRAAAATSGATSPPPVTTSAFALSRKASSWASVRSPAMTMSDSSAKRAIWFGVMAPTATLPRGAYQSGSPTTSRAPRVSSRFARGVSQLATLLASRVSMYSRVTSERVARPSSRPASSVTGRVFTSCFFRSAQAVLRVVSGEMGTAGSISRSPTWVLTVSRFPGVSRPKRFSTKAVSRLISPSRLGTAGVPRRVFSSA